MTNHSIELAFAVAAAVAVPLAGRYLGAFLHWAEQKLTHQTIRPHVVTPEPVQPMPFVPPTSSFREYYEAAKNQSAMSQHEQAKMARLMQNTAGPLSGRADIGNLGSLLGVVFRYNIKTGEHEKVGASAGEETTK